MPKAGKYDYPARDLEDCIDSLRMAYENSKSYVMTRDSFGAAIKHSPKGGGFNLLVGSVGMFGLAETGAGELRYTNLAKRILFGEKDEIPKAEEEAVRKIALLAEIYDKYGPNVTDDQLRLFLKDRAVVDIAEANDLAQVVGKLFKSHLRYMTPMKSGGGEKDKLNDMGTGTSDAPPSGYTDYNLGDLGLVRVSKEDTIDKWEKIKQALDILIGTKAPKK